MTWTTPRSPVKAPLVAPNLNGSQTPSPAAQVVRIGSRSAKSDAPPKLITVAPAVWASFELQNGLDFLVCTPLGAVGREPMPLPGGSSSPTSEYVPSVRSPSRQACVRPPLQTASPAAQSAANRFFQFRISDRRTGLAQS